MKLLTIIILSTMTIGCAKMPIAPKVVHSKRIIKTRADRYMGCILRLNQDGLKQTLIKTLCDSSYGSID